MTTINQVKKMTDHSLRIAIAKARGYAVINGHICIVNGGIGIQLYNVGTNTKSIDELDYDRLRGGMPSSEPLVPDYPNDIKAMQEVVNKVIEPQNDAAMQSYIYKLLQVTQGEDCLEDGNPFNWYDIEACTNATARERAEAFFLSMCDEPTKPTKKPRIRMGKHRPRLTADGHPAHGCESCDGDDICTCPDKNGRATCLLCGGAWPECAEKGVNNGKP